MPPADIHFVRASDGARVAYSITGTGSHVTIKAGMWLSHIEFDSTNPLNRHWRDAMEARGGYVRYDARGCGLSDWDPPRLDFDAWVRDLEAVADSAGPVAVVERGDPSRSRALIAESVSPSEGK